MPKDLESVRAKVEILRMVKESQKEAEGARGRRARGRRGRDGQR